MAQPDSATTIIDLIRHGEPDGGPRFRGSQDDPLSSVGWRQMESAIAPGERWDRILTSPLQRCQAFATRVSQRLAVPLHTDDRLREIGFGEWEGLSADTIIARYGEQRLTRYWSDADNWPPPGGERLGDFQQRVQAAWHDWSGRLAGQRILLVGHGGVIRVIVGEIMGTPRERVLGALAVPYACRSRVRTDYTPHGVLSCLVSHNPGEF